MRQGELDYAKRKALELFDRWNDVTGAIEKHSSWYHEICSVIEDCADIGAKVARKVDFKLEDYED